jgi:hypothetical protein
MNRDVQPALRRAATSTFELLGFLFATEEIDGEALDRPLAVRGVVEFHGPVEGCLELRLTGDLVPELAANMMGTDEVPDEATCRDAVGELVNVICGNLLPELAGYDAVFDLTPPLVGADADPLPRRGQLVAEEQLGVEAGRAELRMWMTEASPVGAGP